MNISIIIPSFNQGQYIKRTLESILQQKVGSLQVIVSDGGSTDATVPILRSYGERIIWWSKADAGYADAVNKAIPHVTGEVVGIQSSDDFYLEGAFSAVEAAFLGKPDTGIVSGGHISIDLMGNIKNINRMRGIILPRDHLRSILPQHATFIRTDILRQLGGVRESVDMCADADLWLRALQVTRGVRIKKIIGVYQLHPEQRTAKSDRWISSLSEMLAFSTGSSDRDSDRSVTELQKSEFIDFAKVYFAITQKHSNVGDVAKSIVNSGMRGYRHEVRALVAHAAASQIPSKIRKLTFFASHGLLTSVCIGVAKRVMKDIAIKRAANSLNVNWVSGT